jgi:hypothetical protein
VLIATLLQLFAACAGVVGSLFFAIGVMRQSVDEMSKLSSTYFGWNPHMINAVAAQKADYLFGGCIIVCAFFLQLVSFLVPQSAMAYGPFSRACPIRSVDRPVGHRPHLSRSSLRLEIGRISLRATNSATAGSAG